MQTNDQTVKKLATHLLNLQADKNTDLSKLQKIEALEAENSNIIEESQYFEETAPALKKQRGLLLAEQATGEADHSKEIAKLDIEIAEAERYDQQVKQAKTAGINQAKETLQGLQDVKAKLLQGIAEKRRNIAVAQHELLMKFVEDERDKYQAAADNLIESALNLSALDAIVAKNGVATRSGVMPLYNQIMKIPALNGMGMRHGKSCNHHTEFFFDWQTNLPAKPEQVNNLLAHLAAYGIEV